MPDERSYETRRAILNVEPLWTTREVALYLGVSVRTVASLSIPRCQIGGVRYVPEVVRQWALLQLSYQLPQPAA